MLIFLLLFIRKSINEVVNVIRDGVKLLLHLATITSLGEITHARVRLVSVRCVLSIILKLLLCIRLRLLEMYLLLRSVVVIGIICFLEGTLCRSRSHIIRSCAKSTDVVISYRNRSKLFTHVITTERSTKVCCSRLVHSTIVFIKRSLFVCRYYATTLK